MVTETPRISSRGSDKIPLWCLTPQVPDRDCQQAHAAKAKLLRRLRLLALQGFEQRSSRAPVSVGPGMSELRPVVLTRL